MVRRLCNAERMTRSQHVGVAVFLAVAAMPSRNAPALALTPQPPELRSASRIAPGVLALPRLADPQGMAAARVNAALQKGDDELSAAIVRCRRHDPAAFGPPGYWKRDVIVAMLGVRYLAIVETDANFCGGAHGTRWTRPWVFDLRSGAPADWSRPLPHGWSATTRGEQVWQGIEVRAVVSGQLQQVYRHGYVVASQRLPASVRADCQDAVTNTGASILWPDARGDGIALLPSGLPSAVSVCAVAVTIGVSALRRLGFAPGLLDDIQGAHARS